MNFQVQQEIEALVEGFESCRTNADEFSHRHHLVVAAWYLHNGSEQEALARMKSGLVNFLTHHGVDLEKYNETMTLFWLKMVHRVLANLGPQATIVEVANAVLQNLNSSRLIFDYYTEERVKSAEARTRWVDPDLQRLGEL